MMQSDQREASRSSLVPSFASAGGRNCNSSPVALDEGTLCASIWQRINLKKTRAELLAGDSEESCGHGGGLQRSLRTLDLIAVGVGATVGTGVFSITGQVARTQAGPAVVLCWAIGGVGCMLSALSYMELSARLPVTGSVYAFAYHSLGEVFAVVGAACITLEYGISASAVAANWGDKLKLLIETWGAPTAASYLSMSLGPVAVSFPALVLLLIITIMIALGGNLGKCFTRSSSGLAIVLILVMVIFSLCHFDAANLEPLIPPEYGARGLFSGCVTTFFGFLGYDEVCCLAGEAENPRKSVPRAVVGTLAIATALPILGSIGLCGLLPYTEINKSAGFEAAFRQKGWHTLASAASIGELIVLFVVTYMCFLAQPRVFYALAKDGLLPRKFLDVDSAGSPRFGTYATGVLLILCGAFLPFDLLANAISGGVLVAFTLVNCSVIMLRIDSTDDGSCRWGSHRLLGIGMGVFAFFSEVACFSIRHAFDVDSSIAAVYYSVGFVAGLIAFLALVGVAMHKRQFGMDRIRPGQNEDETFFRVPFMPWLPVLAIIFNNVMLASLEIRDFGILLLYLALVLLPYFVFVCWRARQSSGRSCLAHQQEACASPMNGQQLTVSS